MVRKCGDWEICKWETLYSMFLRNQQCSPPTHTHILCLGPLSYQTSYLPGFAYSVRRSTLKNM